jgi:hypothetical protein
MGPTSRFRNPVYNEMGGLPNSKNRKSKRTSPKRDRSTE